MGNHSFSPGDLPDPGIQRGSPALQADSLPSEPQGKTKLIILLFIVLSHMDEDLTLNVQICLYRPLFQILF